MGVNKLNAQIFYNDVEPPPFPGEKPATATDELSTPERASKSKPTEANVSDIEKTRAGTLPPMRPLAAIIKSIWTGSSEDTQSHATDSKSSSIGVKFNATDDENKSKIKRGAKAVKRGGKADRVRENQKFNATDDENKSKIKPGGKADRICENQKLKISRGPPADDIHASNLLWQKCSGFSFDCLQGKHIDSILGVLQGRCLHQRYLQLISVADGNQPVKLRQPPLSREEISEHNAIKGKRAYNTVVREYLNGGIQQKRYHGIFYYFYLLHLTTLRVDPNMFFGKHVGILYTASIVYYMSAGMKDMNEMHEKAITLLILQFSDDPQLKSRTHLLEQSHKSKDENNHNTSFYVYDRKNDTMRPMTDNIPFHKVTDLIFGWLDKLKTPQNIIFILSVIRSLLEFVGWDLMTRYSLPVTGMNLRQILGSSENTPPARDVFQCMLNNTQYENNAKKKQELTALDILETKQANYNHHQRHIPQADLPFCNAHKSEISGAVFWIQTQIEPVQSVHCIDEKSRSTRFCAGLESEHRRESEIVINRSWYRKELVICNSPVKK